jgi:hypothetical protein
MSDKKYTPREAALAVLAKAQELFNNSELAKAEKLKKDSGQTLGAAIGFPGAAPTAPMPSPSPASKSEIKKYESENKKKPSSPDYSKEVGKKEGRDFNDYEVKSGKKTSKDEKRQAKQVSPSKNPKEEAEGNNEPYGTEPKNEFAKAENPDKKEDAELGEDVEHLVEDHFEENKEDEKKEGHKLMTKSCPNCGTMHKSEDFASLCGELEEMKKSEKMDKHGLSPEEIRAKMKHPGKSAEIKPMEKHGLSPAQIKEKMASSAGKAHYPKETGKAEAEHVKENSPDISNPDAARSSVGIPRGAKSEDISKPNVFIPAKAIGSAKLSKFMERKHAKRKASMSSPMESESHENRDTPEENSGERHEQSMQQTSRKTMHSGRQGAGPGQEAWPGRNR